MLRHVGNTSLGNWLQPRMLRKVDRILRNLHYENIMHIPVTSVTVESHFLYIGV